MTARARERQVSRDPSPRKVLFIGVSDPGPADSARHDRSCLVSTEASQHYGTPRATTSRRAWGQARKAAARSSSSQPLTRATSPTTRSRTAERHVVAVKDELYVLCPSASRSAAAPTPSAAAPRDLRGPGLHRAAHAPAGGFAPDRARRGRLPGPAALSVWDQAVNRAVPLTDARSVREPIVLASGSGTHCFEAGGDAGLRASARCSRRAICGAWTSARSTAPQAFLSSFALGGTERARSSRRSATRRVRSSAPRWPSPELRRRLLAERAHRRCERLHRRMARVLDLGRGYPASWRRLGAPPPTVVELGVRRRAHHARCRHPRSGDARATKYGVLILGFSRSSRIFCSSCSRRCAVTASRCSISWIGLGELRVLSAAARARRAHRLRALPTSRAPRRRDRLDHELQRRRAVRSAAPRRADRRLADCALRVPLRHAARRGLRSCWVPGALGVFTAPRSLRYAALTRRIDRFDVTLRLTHPDDGTRTQLHA